MCIFRLATLISLFLLTCNFSHTLSSQPRDSVAFGKVKMQAGKYELNKWGMSGLELKNKAPVSLTELEFKSGEGFAEGVVTLFTGISTSSSTESTWLLDSKVVFKGLNKTVKMPVIVEGLYEKYRERDKDEEGYSSIETSEYVELYWEKGAYGYLIESGDTLGSFEVQLRKSADDSEAYWKHTDQDLTGLEKKLDKHGYYDTPGDFIVKGTFNQRDFVLAYRGELFRCSLTEDDKLTGLWQDKPHVIMLFKKHRIYPYILIPENESEIHQSLTLLSLGQVLSRSLMELYN